MKSKIKYKVLEVGYESIGEFTYYSKRFNKSITIPDKFYSDGASGVIDIDSTSWWVHDYLIRYRTWSDGSRLSNLEASMVLYDILKSEGYYVRAPIWFVGTLIYGTFVDLKNSFKYK